MNTNPRDHLSDRVPAPLGKALLLTLVLAAAGGQVHGWRSSLYPDNWTPAHRDEQGRFLHDFSYAGYHQGVSPIPAVPPGAVYNVTNAPYLADNTGTTDATAAIQAAIDDASSAGGGIVLLPAGTYKVAPPDTNSTCSLLISSNNVVLRGAGTSQTFVRNTHTYMRAKTVILVQPSSVNWHSPLPGTEILASVDIDYPTRKVPLTSVSGLSVGDTIIVRADCTDEFIADHGMTGKWTAALEGPAFCRRITSINVASNTITVDIPIRYFLKTRDNARIYKIGAMLEEVGLEDFSIGMVQSPTPGMGDNDYTVEGTGAYEVHASHAIAFKQARNGWVQRVATYRPPENAGDYHTLSNVLLVDESIHVTVRDCVFMKPQYEGGGGNGYGYTLRGNDCLVTDCVALSCRHNYDFKSMKTSGNVIYRCEARSGRLSSDFHMHLSMANLFDSMWLNGDYLQAVYRPYGTIEHGHSTTESVFWNTYGEGSGTAVESRQWKWGYVIGTSGGRSAVTLGTSYNTAPEDFVEGQGAGATLEPQSLYEDQFARRMQRLLVNAGPDVTLFGTNNAVPLNGAVYNYGDEDITNSVWSQVSGPAAPIADPLALGTTADCSQVGSYVFKLAAWEGSVTNQDEVAVTVLAGAVAPIASKDSIVGRRQSNGPALGYYPDDTNGLAGVTGSNTTQTRHDRNPVFGYVLPTLPAGTKPSAATLHFEITGARDQNNDDPSLNAYLLNTANPDSSGTTFFYHGPGDTNPDVEFVGSTYIAVGTTSTTFPDDQYDQAYPITGDALTTLKSFYGNDHIPDQGEAFFRFNLDTVIPDLTTGNPYLRYVIDTADNESSLVITAQSTAKWGSLVVIH